MGWSVDNVRPQLDVLFAGTRYNIQHPNALSPRVFLQHEGELSLEMKDSIIRLFPEFVYIDFFPNMSFANEPIKIKPLRGRRI